MSSPTGVSFSSLGSLSSLQAIKKRGRKTTNFSLLLAAIFQLIYGLLNLNLNSVGLVSAQPSGVKLSILLGAPASLQPRPLAPLPGRSGLAHLHSLHPTMYYKTDFYFIFFSIFMPIIYQVVQLQCLLQSSCGARKVSEKTPWNSVFCISFPELETFVNLLFFMLPSGNILGEVSSSTEWKSDEPSL